MSEVVIVEPIAQERLLVVTEEPKNEVFIEESSAVRIVQIGSQGPPGPGFSETIIAKVRTYVHRQDTPSDEWTIVHNLDSYPSVTVVDSAEETVIMDVEYIDKNTVICRAIGAFSGKAYLN
jgi:hypothetical protein